MRPAIKAAAQMTTNLTVMKSSRAESKSIT